MGQQELLKVIRELKSLKQMQEELEAEIAAAENVIKAEMIARNIDELKVDIFKICWSKIVSKRFDTSAFRKVHEDLYNIFTRTSETRRFSIV